MRKALVIGATGLLGYDVAQALHKSGWDIRAIGKDRLEGDLCFLEEVEYIQVELLRRNIFI